MSDDEQQAGPSTPDDLRRILMDVNVQMEPLLEHAEGFKATMERRGWSPSAAEAAALQLLQHLIATAFSGAPNAR